MKFLGQGFLKVTARTGETQTLTQTNRRDRTHYKPHLRAGITWVNFTLRWTRCTVVTRKTGSTTKGVNFLAIVGAHALPQRGPHSTRKAH